MNSYSFAASLLEENNFTSSHGCSCFFQSTQLFTKFLKLSANPKYFSAFIDIADRKFTLYVCQTAHGAYITTPTVYRRNIYTRYSVKINIQSHIIKYEMNIIAIYKL